LTVSANVISHRVKESPEEIRAFWTPERMKMAKPMPVPEEILVDTSSIEVGEPGSSKPSPSPGSGAPHWNKTSEWSPVVVTNPGSTPWSAVGKVYYTIDDAYFQCSGSQIGNNTVLTAAHCVYYYGAWASYFVFHPDYPNGGSFYPSWLYAQYNFINGYNFAYDVGMVTFGSTAHFTWWTGSAWNQPISSSSLFVSVGYPASAPYDGNTMYLCLGNAVVPQTVPIDGTVEMLNAMTGGSSGGPWWNLQLSSWYANGVNSFAPVAAPGYMYTPYFATWYQTMFYSVLNAQMNP